MIGEILKLVSLKVIFFIIVRYHNRLHDFRFTQTIDQAIKFTDTQVNGWFALSFSLLRRG